MATVSTSVGSVKGLFADLAVTSGGGKKKDTKPDIADPALDEPIAVYIQRKQEAETATALMEAADILGMAYQEFASHGQKQWMGQFFTPIGVCEMMAAMILGDVHAAIATAKKERRRLTVCEPTIGSGAMILGVKRHILKAAGPGGLDHFEFYGMDIDRLCVSMARVQLALTDYRYMANFFIAFAGERRANLEAQA